LPAAETPNILPLSRSTVLILIDAQSHPDRRAIANARQWLVGHIVSICAIIYAAAVETFFKSLKAELLWRQTWPTRRQAEAAIFQYINGFYNARRRHSYLGGISPLAFEAKVA